MTEHLTAGYSLLKQASDITGIASTDARKWLVNALDPFHDVEVEKVGMPDIQARKSNVMEIRHSIDVFSSTPYDFMVDICDYLPWDSAGDELAMWEFNTVLSSITKSIPNSYLKLSTGNVRIKSSTNHTPYYPRMLGPTTPQTPVDDASFHTDMKVCNRTHCRIIAAGFEVVPTSSPLQTTGAITVARRKPGLMAENNVSLMPIDNTISPIINYGWRQGTISTLPYPSVADANKDPDTRQWSATEGCYCVATVKTEGPDVNAWYKDRFLFLASEDAEKTERAMVAGLGPHDNINVESIKTNGSRFGIAEPCSAYITGCSETSTFQVNFRFTVEVFPNNTNAMWLVANPSPYYSPEALLAYARATQNMPTGVMLKENPMGEWFEKVMSFLAAGATPALSAIGLAPVGAAASSVFSTLGNLNKRYRLAENDSKRRRID